METVIDVSPLQTISRRLYAFVDWFIPRNLREGAEIVQSVRMFLFSHIFGPFLGHVISVCILLLQGGPDLAWWVFFGAVTLFWPYSFVLRATGLYVPLALISIQNLLFCIFWGCYHYGGISSPILPWLVTVPLLGFFYLPTHRTRIIVSLLITANLAVFYLIYCWFGFPATIALDRLIPLGLVSTFCAGVYVSMMALYYASIVSSQSDLEHEVKRHRATELQLRAATEQVERATRAKSEFLAKMSHELRNPLNAIIGYSEMLLEEAPQDDQKCADLNSIKGAGFTLLELVNDLLDLSKLEAGRMDVYLKKISLDDFMNDVISNWEGRVAESSNKLRIERACPLGDATVDSAKLRQAIDNLMTNAMKHTSCGTITLAATNDDPWITIAVRDTGVGIDPGRIKGLFETFGSQENETSSNYGEDPGLGLPLTARLCHLMKGDITVESTPGRGSCFTIRVQSHPTESKPSGQLNNNDVPTTTAPQHSDRPVLVIDNDQSVLDLVARILTKEGLVSVLSSTAADGLARARAIKPDVILLDIRMPEPDIGWDMLRQLRRDPEMQSCKIILLTVDDDFLKGRALGADAHLLKPVSRDSLLSTIERVRSGTPLVPDDIGSMPADQTGELAAV